jgi:hypothetical protein
MVLFENIYGLNLDLNRTLPKNLTLKHSFCGQESTHRKQWIHLGESTPLLLFSRYTSSLCKGHTFRQIPHLVHLVPSFSFVKKAPRLKKESRRPDGQTLHQERLIKKLPKSTMVKAALIIVNTP